MYKLTNSIAIVSRQMKWMSSLYLDNSYIPGCEVCVVNSHFVEPGWEGEEEGTHGNYPGTLSSHKCPLDSHGMALLLCWGSVLWCGSSWLLQRWPLLLCCSCFWLNLDYTVCHSRYSPVVAGPSLQSYYCRQKIPTNYRQFVSIFLLINCIILTPIHIKLNYNLGG